MTSQQSSDRQARREQTRKNSNSMACKLRLRATWLLSPLVLAVLLTLGTLFSSAHADDRSTSSIDEFVAAKDRWDRLVGRPLRLEGRYTVFSSSELKFAGCDLKFVLNGSFRRPPTTTRNVEVAGQLARKNGGLEFHVTELKPRESDAEQLRLKRSLVDNDDPQAVYNLAAWAQQRGQFYKDDELKAAAQRLYREGLTIAYEHLKPGDVTGLRDLAKKANELGVDKSVAMRHLHQADRLEWEAAQAAGEKDYRRVIGLIRRDFPGAATPLPPDRLSIRKNYQAAPLAVYDVADSSTRRLLERAFYLEVSLADILLSADKSGRNGNEIAKRIERELPELASQADAFRQQELKYLTARLGRLSRTQMVDLSERYKKQGDQQQATNVVRDWLRSQEPRATQAGPTELMELGDEYVNLLQDERAAGRMYKLAYQKNPQLATAGRWLSTHGYELKGRQWSRPGESDEDMADAAIDEAIAEGRVQIGMSGTQVLKTLGTKPTSAIRMASSGEVSELWVFRDYGITVRLQRRNTSKSAQVVAIGTVD